LLPLQVRPPNAAPQRALVETLCAVAGALTTGLLVAEDGDARLLEGVAGASLHEPNLVWQPDPQYALLLPQYPCWEQQLPKTLLRQVWLDTTPHLPLVDVFRLDDTGEGVETGVFIEETEDGEQEPKLD
jgi:hypothetical protein